MNEEKQKVQNRSAEQKASNSATEKKATPKPGKDPHRLKRAWENLKKQQEEALKRRRASKVVGQISDVKIVKDKEGNEKVRVDMVGGGKILDQGDKSHLYSKMKPKRKVSHMRLRALMNAVKARGWAAIAADLTPEMREILQKACERNGIRLADAAKKATPVTTTTKTKVAKTSGTSKPATSSKRMKDMMKNFSIDTKRTQNAVHVLKNYLIQEEDARLAREKKAVREKYNKEQIDEFRTDLYGKNGKAAAIEEKLRNGQKLTQAEQNLWNKKEKYGIQKDASKEKLTAEQKMARGKMTTRDYSKPRAKDFNAEIARKTAICETKVHAYKVAAEELLLEAAKGKKVDISQENLVRQAMKRVPPRDKRSISTLTKVSQELTTEEKKVHKEVLTERENTKKHIEAEMKKAMALENQTPENVNGKQILQEMPPVQKPFARAAKPQQLDPVKLAALKIRTQASR